MFQVTHIRLKFNLFLVALLSGFATVTGQIPSGYYNAAAGQNGEALQIALYNLIKGHQVLAYTPGVWNAFYKTDLKANGKIWDMYSDVPGGTPPYEYDPGTSQCGEGSSGLEGDCYSREHAFPASWFGNVSPMNTDLFHIVPADQFVNNMHNYFPMADVGTATTTSLNGSKKGNCATIGYSGTVFEPIDAYKGDFARAYFYMATRYENVIAHWDTNNVQVAAVLNGTSYPAFETWYLNLLLSWHDQDPVSPKEIARNDSIYKIQHNRNPFIDHPEYVDSVWMPFGPLPEPVSHVTNFTASAGSPAYSAIHLTWTDATGAVTPAGYLIRGSATGFSDIVAPVDCTPVANSILDQNIGLIAQACNITGLQTNTTYYFKIFPYTNAGNSINYKTGEPVPAISFATTAGISVLQAGDIAIIEYGSLTTDRLSFITFKPLTTGTVINFTDNGFTSPTTVRTGEGFLVYTALSAIPAGTVISWYNGMNIAGTGWSSNNPGNFDFSATSDQLFAYQGSWTVNPTLICGLNAGNGGWITTGIASSTTSYFPAGLTNEVNALTFSQQNGNYNLITTGSVSALGSLAANPVNWTKSNAVIPTPAWLFSISGSTTISQHATMLNLTVGSDETVTVQPGIILTVSGDLNIY